MFSVVWVLKQLYIFKQLEEAAVNETEGIVVAEEENTVDVQRGCCCRRVS